MAAAQELGYPVVVKPVAGHKGQGVTTGIQSAAEALESLHSRQPDVILAEKKLLQAEGNGSVLKESERLAPDAEIILMAPEEEAPSPTVELQGRQNRVFQVITKPVSIEDIQGVIHRAAEVAKVLEALGKEVGGKIDLADYVYYKVGEEPA